MAILWVYEHLKPNDKMISKRAILAGLVAFTLTGFFMAWRDQHQALQKEKDELGRVKQELEIERAKNTPDLRGQILYYAAGNTKTEPGTTEFVLTVNVRNLGAPSIATDWDVSIEPPGTLPIHAPPIHFIGTRLFQNDKGSGLEVNSADLIFDKMVETPIPKGGAVNGILYCLIKGIKREALTRAGVTLRVYFSDVMGKRYVVSQQLTGQDLFETPHMPGLKTRPVAPRASPK